MVTLLLGDARDVVRERERRREVVPLERLLGGAARLSPDRRFVIAGPGYPEHCRAQNVERVEHVAPGEHPGFYAAQRLTLNVTRAAMVDAGWSPSVRLFEAAACGVPIVSDWWSGLDAFFTPGEEIFVAETSDEAAHIVRNTDGATLARVAERARARVLREHTAERRAEQLEREVDELVRAAA
jgi:spore maturation protein CgeB